MDAWSGAVAVGPVSRGLEIFAGVRLAVDVVHAALSLEEGSRLFYEAVSGILDDRRWRSLFSELAKAEEGHREKLLEASRAMTPGETAEIPGETAPPERMEGAARVADALAWARAAGRTPLEILEMSMQTEADSLDLYMKAARRPEFGALGGILDGLVDDEKEHLRRLGALLERHAREGPGAGVRGA